MAWPWPQWGEWGGDGGEPSEGGQERRGGAVGGSPEAQVIVSPALTMIV
jgi:hypothetical protein